MSKKRSRKRYDVQAEDIPMTPMIDVVFQLLIYFLVTIQPKDVVAHLDVFRPSPESTQEKPETPPKMIRIVVYTDGFTINDKPVSIDSLQNLLGKLASIDPNQTILIMVTQQSPHRKLIQVLDSCAQVGLNNLSVISSN